MNIKRACCFFGTPGPGFSFEAWVALAAPGLPFGRMETMLAETMFPEGAKGVPRNGGRK